MKKQYRSILIICIWILLWQTAAVWIDRKIIFVGPLDVAEALVMQITDMEFWQTILQSSIRICGGFLISFLLAVLIGILSSRYYLIKEFLEPAVGLLQSVPVASFVILALIWAGSDNLAVLISLIVVFPVIYRNTLQGMRAADKELLEMAEVFRLGWGRRFWYIYRPALFPYLISAVRIAFGMAWKSGVAAEVIGVPDTSIGEKLYMAKIYLSTAELFAWTLVIIVVSRIFEKLFLQILGLFDVKRTKESGHVIHEAYAEPGKAAAVLKKAENAKVEMQQQNRNPDRIAILHISKSYPDKVVLHDFSQEFAAGGIYCLMGASGIGKTTLLRILMGLESADEIYDGADGGLHNRRDGLQKRKYPKGITGLENSRISTVFQENRLFVFADAIKNMRLSAGREGLLYEPEELLGGILEQEAWRKPVSQLSGGMQRRVAVLRALAVKSDFMIMDEPFTGLDAETKERLIKKILTYRNNRTLLVVTHQEDDAGLLGAEVIRM